MKKLWKKAAMAAMAGALALTGLPLTAGAAGAATKDETVYVNLNGDGSVSAAYVVNAFELNEAGAIADCGDYAAVENLSTTDALTYADGIVSTGMPAGRFYYQGTLTDTALPWDFNISYRLNGQAVSPNELAGADGDIQIHLQSRQGDSRHQSFFDNYVLQMSYTLDANKCSELTGDGANIVLAGKTYNVNYTVMQGKEADYTLSLKAEDFEMGAIQIRALHTSGIDIDTSEFDQKIDDAQDDFGKLADGVAELADKGGDLASASGKFYSGLKKFQSGAGDIAAASSQVSSGISGLSASLSQLAVGSAEADALAQALLASPDPQVQALAQAYLQVSGGTAAAAAGAATLAEQYQTFDAGLQGLPDNAADMVSGYRKLNGGIGSYSDAVDELNDNVAEIPGKLDDMETEVSDTIEKFTNPDFTPVSFASAKNSVSSVLFVMRTEAVTIPEVQEEPEPVSKPDTIWEKLLDLFGLYEG